MHLCLALLLAAAAPEAPAPEDPLLVRARRLFEDLKFEEARAAYEQASQVRLATVEEVAAAYKGLGLVAATLGDEAAARAAFLKVLALKPDTQLSGRDVSPRQRAPFEAARQIAAGKLPPRIEHVPAALWPPRQPIVLRVEVASDWQAMVGGVRLLLRRGAGAYEELASMGKAPFEITVPPTPEGTVEYYLEGIDAHGCPLTHWGGPDAPARVRVGLPEAPATTPLYRQAWPYLVVGVVVAGLAGAVAYTALQDPVYRVETRKP